MGSNEIFQLEVLNLLGQLKAKREAVEKQLIAVDKQIEAVGLTVGLLRESKANGPVATYSDALSTVSVQDLVGKSSRQALITIAKKNGGKINISTSKTLLISAGVIKSRKNAWGAVNTTLSRSREFEKESPGWYRLVEAADAVLPLQ